MEQPIVGEWYDFRGERSISDSASPKIAAKYIGTHSTSGGEFFQFSQFIRESGRLERSGNWLMSKRLALIPPSEISEYLEGTYTAPPEDDQIIM